MSINARKTACSFAIAMMASALTSVSAMADSGGLQTSVSVDMTGQAFSRNKDIPSRFNIREAEIFFFAPIDPWFDGILGIAAHQEGGVALFELHEATIGSSKLLPYSRFKVGQYFLNVGKLNSTHRHDWPFISAPRVHQEFFGEEGVVDSGIEYTVLPPLPFFLELTMGVTNGWTFGHSHDEGSKPKTPTHYARLLTYTELPGNGGMQVGFNYLGRTDSEKARTTMAGIDLTAKWREGKTLPFLLQGEAWLRDVKPDNAPLSRSFGYYLYPQVHVIGMLDFGLKLDGYTILTLKDALGNKVENFEQSFAPSLQISPSEFSRFRVSWRWTEQKNQSSAWKVTDSWLELQTTFILGAHPAHDF